MPSLSTVMTPVRVLATRLAYEIGAGRALDNASQEARQLDQTLIRDLLAGDDAIDEGLDLAHRARAHDVDDAQADDVARRASGPFRVHRIHPEEACFTIAAHRGHRHGVRDDAEFLLPGRLLHRA